MARQHVAGDPSAWKPVGFNTRLKEMQLHDPALLPGAPPPTAGGLIAALLS
jgi:hypothetical protein